MTTRSARGAGSRIAIAGLRPRAAALLGVLAAGAILPAAAVAQTSEDESAVAAVLDALHDAASNAEFDRYFGLYTDDAIFLGTDATERWTLEEFKAYARAPFEAGRGWTYHPTERHVYISADGRTAWFDEKLENAGLGETRGSGALVREGDAWKVAQYNLTIPVPNALARDFVGQIRALDAGTPAGPAAMRDVLLGQFRGSSAKISQLIDAVPQDLYSWSPGPGVMQVGEVYMHIARYNFMYLDENLGIAPPDGFAYADIESIRDRDRVREIYAMSVAHVEAALGAMTPAELTAETTLYGRTVPGWAVLTQLVAHMNEHVGQSVSYARMNDIVPPWSR